MNALLNNSRNAEEVLEALADALQVSEARHQAADRSYKSLAAWLHRPESTLLSTDPDVYIQGSFRLGTAVRPASADEDYDLDLVCEMNLSKSNLTQAQVKALLGSEMAGYAKSKGMTPPDEGRRCWTLQYHDGAQFHLDALPALPDGARQRLLLESAGLSTTWTDTAIAITDKDHRNYRSYSPDWPHSNPRGYARWFQARMAAVFEARRRVLAMEARASVEDIPEYAVRTPLQSAIQILKHHRDLMFADRCEDKPISIIITTLAAMAYGQQTTIGATLVAVLSTMETFIETRNGVRWIANPTDGAENFADRWVSHPERQAAFYEWLHQARADFYAAAAASSRAGAALSLEPRLRSRITAQVFDRLKGNVARAAGAAASAIRQILNPPHRQPVPWTAVDQGHVQIGSALVERSGFRPDRYYNGGSNLPKRCSLTFEAETNVPAPYKVYWQIVNTGSEAAAVAGGLRGGFNEGVVSVGKLTRREDTLYTGVHSIECFIVKNGLLAARSGQFIVNIG